MTVRHLAIFILKQFSIPFDCLDTLYALPCCGLLLR